MIETRDSRPPTAPGKPALGALAGEWIKFWTLRSNRVLAAIALLFVPLNGVLLAVSLRQRAEDPDTSFLIPSVEPAAFVDSVLWVQLLISVIAVLFATSENGGFLGVSFLATPKRVPVALAKAAVIASVVFVIGTVGALVGLLLPSVMLTGTEVTYHAPVGDVVGLALGSGAYLAGVALVAYGIAVLVRNIVIAVLAPIALFTIVPAVLEWVGGDTIATLAGYFPSVAGRTAISAMVNPAGLDAETGLLVLGGWAVIAVVGAALVYRHRDA